MTGEYPKVPDAEPAVQGAVILSSSNVAPTLADVQRMFKVSKESAGRDVEWIWSDAGLGRTFKLRAWYPVIVDRQFWDYELRDDPTWTFSDDRPHGNPVIWQYKTSDQHLVFEITRMVEKERSGAEAPTASVQSAYAQVGVAITDEAANALYSSKTGVLSYSAFLLLAEREFDWFRTYGNPVSLAVFDVRSHRLIDDKAVFLPVETVQLVGKRLMRRLSDTLGHFESFDLALLMPNTDSQQAATIANRAMQILTKLPLNKEGDSTSLSVTCGLASIPANGVELRDLIMGARMAKNQALENKQPILFVQPGQVIPHTTPANRATAKESGPISLKDLMLRTTLVSVEQFDTSAAFSQRMRTPLSRVLAMEGHVKEATLDAAIEIEAASQTLHIPIEDAVRAVRLVEDHALDLDTAMRRIGLNRGGIKLTSFGRLLRDCGFLSRDDLRRANQQSIAARLSLTAVLIKLGLMTETVLKDTFRIMRLIGRTVSREDAIRLLEEWRTSGNNLTEVLHKVGVTEPPSPSTTLGERLLQDNKLSPLELLSAYEIELTQNKDLESVLLDQALATEPTLTAAKQRLQ